MDNEPTQVSTTEELLPQRKKKIVTLSNGKNVEIQNLNYGEFMDIMIASQENVYKQSLGIVTKGLSKPKLTWEQARQLLPRDIGFLVLEIVNLSGFSSFGKKKGE